MQVGCGMGKCFVSGGSGAWRSTYGREAYGIDYKVSFNACNLGIVLWMSINGYVSSHKLDFSEQARSYLYNSR